jgi:hypothetical protein
MKNEPETKTVKNYYGLSWPTLIVGALVVLAIALSYLWVINTAVVTGN